MVGDDYSQSGATQLKRPSPK